MRRLAPNRVEVGLLLRETAYRSAASITMPAHMRSFAIVPSTTSR